MVLIFGIIGYIMRKFEYPAAPVLLGFILGPLLEENFRRSLLLAGGDMAVFVTEPISLIFLLMTLAFLAVSFLPGLKKAFMSGGE